MKNSVKKLLKQNLPKECNWRTVEEYEEHCEECGYSPSNSWSQCLIALEKHGEDVHILFGDRKPKNQYKEYEYRIYNVSCYNYEPQIIDKKEIIAVSEVPGFYAMARI